MDDYDRGYKDGYEEGYDIGYDQLFIDEQKYLEDGDLQQQSQDYIAGFMEGLSDGHWEGFMDG